MFEFRSPRLWLATLILATALPSVHAGDLSPLNLPSQQRQSPVVASPPVVDSTQQYYNQFEQDMQVSTPEWRNDLKAEFEKKLRLSTTTEEKAHYQRLLNILTKFR